jgi:hypothetical protein
MHHFVPSYLSLASVRRQQPLLIINQGNPSGYVPDGKPRSQIARHTMPTGSMGSFVRLSCWRLASHLSGSASPLRRRSATLTKLAPLYHIEVSVGCLKFVARSFRITLTFSRDITLEAFVTHHR